MLVDRLAEENDASIMGRIKPGECFELDTDPRGKVYVMACYDADISIVSVKTPLPNTSLSLAFCLNSHTLKVFSSNTKVWPVFLRVKEVEGKRDDD